ncbi:GNAT family N-acetyltransferase [Acetobacteraceae bacterium KSS8]|uniref:GNAT family N-acetyltransferase n=1 Tax=Endosaccharibacter trunci TaxID=2812733 RepID=A0ABT1W5H8_9PROT|nr:GNAT family N-acetyltransferase [Acetobacteraceae bacterium KSS8]
MPADRTATPGCAPPVSIRRVREDDGEALIAANQRSLAALRPRGFAVPDPGRVRSWFDAQTQADAASFLVLQDGTDGIAGLLDASRIALGNFRSAYLGYWGFEGFGGRGLMTAGLRRLATMSAGLFWRTDRRLATASPHAP